jgi:hypothetical protein
METALKECMTIAGAVGVCIVDWESGMPLGALGGGKYLDLDVAGDTEVIRAKTRTMESLRLDDTIEDILITPGKQYHLIRLLKNSRNEQGLSLYLVLERSKANLALARRPASDSEVGLDLLEVVPGAGFAQAIRSRICRTRSIEVCGCRNANRATVSPSHAEGGIKAT